MRVFNEPNAGEPGRFAEPLALQLPLALYKDGACLAHKRFVEGALIAVEPCLKALKATK